MVAIIYVSAHLVGKADAKPITVERDGEVISVRRVEILGPSVIKYDYDSPLKWGARCWIETDSELRYE